MDLNTLADNFGILLDAPDAVTRLRELIIELAIRGSLVRQDPKDVIVDDLIEKVEHEKRLLLSRGLFKRTSLTQIITNDEAPFPAPNGWLWITLGSTGRIFNGNSVSESGKFELSNITAGLPFIATKDVGYGRDEIVYNNGLRVPHNDPRFKVAHTHAVLICAEGGSAGKKMGQTNQNICFGNKLYANETWQGIDPRYILTLYQSPTFFSEFSARMTGIIGGIAQSEFLSLPVPLPPTAEQVRIVARVEYLMQLCDELEQKKEKVSKTGSRLCTVSLGRLVSARNADEFDECWGRVKENFDLLYSGPENIAKLQAALTELAVTGRLAKQTKSDSTGHELLRKIKAQSRVPEPTQPSEWPDNAPSLPETWAWASLSSLITLGPKNGYSPKAVNYPTPVKALTLSATTSGKFNPACFKYIDEPIPDDSPLWLTDGDVLFQRGNSIEYVGVSAVYRGPKNEFIYPDLMMKVRFTDFLHLEYICLVLNSYWCRQYLRSRASGTSSSMPKINQQALNSLPLPIPPFEEQRRVVARWQALQDIINNLSIQFKEVGNLRERFSQAALFISTSERAPLFSRGRQNCSTDLMGPPLV